MLTCPLNLVLDRTTVLCRLNGGLSHLNWLRIAEEADWNDGFLRYVRMLSYVCDISFWFFVLCLIILKFKLNYLFYFVIIIRCYGECNDKQWHLCRIRTLNQANRSHVYQGLRGDWCWYKEWCFAFFPCPVTMGVIDILSQHVLFYYACQKWRLGCCSTRDFVDS